MELSFFRNKKVLVTGHTGFKGSWLTEILLDAGAEVIGYSLEPPTDPSLFEIAGLSKRLGERNVIGDIRDLPKLMDVFQKYQPEFVIHMAAQPIVRESYKQPVMTYEVNVMGTVNVLECVRKTPSVKSVLNVTTDKVYENAETGQAYVETDRLDGYDPYSNSKSCSELVTHSYKKSFLDQMGVRVSTARAGNVIGGGDYAADRIVPDCVRACESGKPVEIRNPYSVRPFQHVLEPLLIYLTILQSQYEFSTLAGYYNVGPDKVDCLSAGRVAELFCSFYGDGASYRTGSSEGPHEAGLLMLDNSKIREVFGWKPRWNAEEAIRRTVEFVKAEDKIACMKQQISEFFEEGLKI